MERMLTKKTTAAGCTMEVTVMKIGEDFQICLCRRRKAAYRLCGAGRTTGIADRRRELECDFLGVEPHRT